MTGTWQLRAGATGEAVGELHQVLAELGYDLEPLELERRAFGASTMAAVRDFQAWHHDTNGRALAIDGIVGPRTWWALRHLEREPGTAFVAKGWYRDPGALEVAPVLDAAIGELGAREVPPRSNRGPRVDVYTGGRAVRWCAAFVSWCWSHAAGRSPFGKCFRSEAIAEWGRKTDRLVGAGELLRPGDVFVILSGSEAQRGERPGHCGLIVAVSRWDELAPTIEGNFSDAVRGGLRAPARFTAVVRPLPLED